MRWTRRWAKRARALLRRDAVERELAEEVAFHLELEAEKHRRAGLAAGEARRAAALAFGPVERSKEGVRDARWLAWAPGLSLDLKLGARMLVKYPGLTVIGGLAMAFAIALGVAGFELVTQTAYPSLPLPDGDRIVAVRNWDAAENEHDMRAMRDFATWRAELRSVRDLGAVRTVEQNLILGDGSAAPVVVAEISASAFRVTRVPPLLGRPLVEDDERVGAPPVAVIGYDAWQARFAGDPGVVGRVVRLDTVATTVVGVMPDGFAFPVSQSFWMPLRLNPADYERGHGPDIRVFGRLAPGVSLAEAQAELGTIGRRAAADARDGTRQFRPQVLPYARSFLNLSSTESIGLMSSNLLMVLVVLLTCGNVALLLFARAASREGELAVRTALGASRGRLVGQLFAEALVLNTVATAVGLVAAALVLRWGLGEMAALVGGEFPFWLRDTLSPAAVLWSVVLTVLGAVVAGVVPALKVTRGLGTRLRRASAGGGGLQFGGIWTAVIVSQIAVTVAVPVHAYSLGRESFQIRAADPGVRAGDYLSARLEMDQGAMPAASGGPRRFTLADSTRGALAARFAAAYDELARRLAAEPGVAGVTFGQPLPGMLHSQRWIDVDGDTATRPDTAARHLVTSATVALNFFEIMNAPVLAGRGFHAGDLETGARHVVVNRAFVERVLGGRNPIGQRVRSSAPETDGGAPGPWYEIVGVVRDMGMWSGFTGGTGAGLYYPAAAGRVHPVHLAVRVRGTPEALAPRLRLLATTVDPTLRVHDVVPLADVHRDVLRWLSALLWLTVGGIAVAVLLSLAGIYAVMSFTVARRTREIGVRVALGADARRVVLAIFRRPLTQVLAGVAVGGVFAGVMLSAEGIAYTPGHVALLAAYVLCMCGVCLLACVVPTRRALRVEPTEALRADG